MNTVRFAPSPTGRFHLGNLRTAWISHHIARRLGLGWWLRFEDIDRPRVIDGAESRQLADLERLGLVARGPHDGVERQSDRRKVHWARFLRAVEEGVAYPCICSRREIEQELTAMASAPHAEPEGAASPAVTYPGTCRARGSKATLALHTPGRSIAWRFGSSHTIIARTLAPPRDDCGFEPSYHWACALDDANPIREHSILVRAWDLADATPIQREIQLWAEGPGFRPPIVFHTALITQEDGHRLEKRTQGVTLEELLAAGWTGERLTERFDASFRSLCDFDSIDWNRPSQLLGESRRTMKLSEMLGP